MPIQPRMCSSCGVVRPKSEYSKSQWSKKKYSSKSCKDCIAADVHPNHREEFERQRRGIINNEDVKHDAPVEKELDDVLDAESWLKYEHRLQLNIPRREREPKHASKTNPFLRHANSSNAIAAEKSSSYENPDPDEPSTGKRKRVITDFFQAKKKKANTNETNTNATTIKDERAAELQPCEQNGIDGCNDTEDETSNLSERLRSILKKAFVDNREVADAWGVGDAMPPQSEWIEWAESIAEKYAERAKCAWGEHQNDVHENITHLDELAKETRGGYSGSRAYICALNCILQDSFARCSIPLPPGMDLRYGIALRHDSAHYKAQMRAWRGYRSRVWGLISTIEDNPIASGDGSRSYVGPLPEITIAKKRKAMTRKMSQDLNGGYSASEDESSSDPESEDEYLGYGQKYRSYY